MELAATRRPEQGSIATALTGGLRLSAVASNTKTMRSAARFPRNQATWVCDEKANSLPCVILRLKIA